MVGEGGILQNFACECMVHFTISDENSILDLVTKRMPYFRSEFTRKCSGLRKHLTRA